MFHRQLIAKVRPLASINHSPSLSLTSVISHQIYLKPKQHSIKNAKKHILCKHKSSCSSKACQRRARSRDWNQRTVR